MAADDEGAFDNCDDKDYVRARIVATKALIVAYEAAILALSTGSQSYQLDTGQSRQFVTKAQLGSLQLTLARLEARLATLQQQLGRARFQVRPGW
jgi:hypothetical protein